jgi:hypothetical protein
VPGFGMGLLVATTRMGCAVARSSPGTRVKTRRPIINNTNQEDKKPKNTKSQEGHQRNKITQKSFRWRVSDDTLVVHSKTQI